MSTTPHPSAERPLDPENAALLAELLDQAAALIPPGRTLDEVLAAVQTDEPDDEPDTAAAEREREIDEILARGPRDLVGLVLDTLDLAMSADERAERSTLAAEAARAELRTLRRRLGLDGRSGS